MRSGNWCGDEDAVHVGHPILGTVVDVTGQIINSQIILSGTGVSASGKSIVLDVACTLITATAMFGDFTMTQSSTIVAQQSLLNNRFNRDRYGCIDADGYLTNLSL